MTERDEVLRWLLDARASLRSARRAVASAEWRDACQAAQLATELGTKAVVAAFAEPHWTHDPSGQIGAALAADDAAIESVIGPGGREVLVRLREDVHAAAPWHGWSTYGRRRPDGSWAPAVEVCDEASARDLLERAERSVEAGERVLRARPGD